jgi:carboxyl-terminal processing protease
MKHLKNLIQTLFIACISVSTYHYLVNQHNSTSNKLDSIVDLVNEKYVDSVNVNDLQKVALNAIFNHLDPHSAYLESSDIAARNEDLQGTFFGIGVRYSIIKDSLVVTGIVPDGPASASKLEIGDRIVGVDHTEVKGKWLATDSIKSLLKGAENTAVNLEVFRHTNNKKMSIALVDHLNFKKQMPIDGNC